jgi:hypothetical protein
MVLLLQENHPNCPSTSSECECPGFHGSVKIKALPCTAPLRNLKFRTCLARDSILQLSRNDFFDMVRDLYPQDHFLLSGGINCELGIGNRAEKYDEG